MAKSALDFATEIEKALASGSWRHTELANRIEMYVETRLEARAPEQGGEMRDEIERAAKLISDGSCYLGALAAAGDKRAKARMETLHEAWDILRALLARESAEAAEKRGPEVDALLWMAEHLMGSSVAMTMRGWLAEYRAAGRLAVRNASGATIGQYPEEATR